MTADEKLRLAVSVACAAASSGEYSHLERIVEVIYRKLNELAPGEQPEHDFEL